MKTAKTASERPSALRYVETSAVIAALVENDAAAMSSLAADGVLVTSALAFVESRRAMAIRRASGRLDEAGYRQAIEALVAIERRCDLIVMAPDILTRTAASFSVEPVRTLDAIHLASIESLDEDPQNVVVVTRDKHIEVNARAMGYGVE
jgi:stalled ribosome rescue protein Dom34